MDKLASDDFWLAKLAAWTHDPAEKALVLMRTPHGHEGGTVRKIRSDLGLNEVSDKLLAAVKKADHWASAADRPQFPTEQDGGRYQAWATVQFAKDPQLRHPLSGELIELPGLSEVEPAHIEALSFSHMASLLEGVTGARERFLRLWALASESPAPGLGELWRYLPADTRVPDHSIWDHLRVTSAFAGIFAINEEPALLSLSIGPVQSFIEQGRSTSDLWAGSHLLSTLSWTAMRAIAEMLGPDAILFPDLTESAFARLWLHEQQLVSDDRLHRWRLDRASDANPAYIASLPNRFVALVPAGMGSSLAERVTTAVRGRAAEIAEECWRAACGIVGGEPSPFSREQLSRQLDGFPEVHYGMAPFSLVGQPEGRLEVSKLERAIERMHGPKGGDRGSFLDSPGWQVLSKEIEIEGAKFFSPNPGVVYPAVFDLAERALAAGKASRAFHALDQQGYRCTLCGEREALVEKESERDHHRVADGSLWAQLRKKRPSWASEGDRLCAVCLTKRVWGHRFSDELQRQAVGEEVQVRRYVVSTHTMAMTSTLEDICKDDRKRAQLEAELSDLREDPRLKDARAALPRRISEELERAESRLARWLPAALDVLDELGDEDSAKNSQRVRGSLSDVLGRKPDDYYALVLMDGDRMGTWFSGSDPQTGRRPYKELWHRNVLDGLRGQPFGQSPELNAYLEASAGVSPSYHAALSRALSDLSTAVFPEIVERAFLGKILYAGGDDLLAMASVEEVCDLMLALRCAYSGIDVSNTSLAGRFADVGIRLGRGHALVGPREKKRLYRTMSQRATLSMGVVVAHHKTPLQSVLRELRDAEKKAKNNGRDSFRIALMKRAGGTSYFTARWALGGAQVDHEPAIAMLSRLRQVLSSDVSRRASYSITEWLSGMAIPKGVPRSDETKEMLASSMAWLFRRKAHPDANASERLGVLAEQLAILACKECGDSQSPVDYLVQILRTAEFLARPERRDEGAEES